MKTMILNKNYISEAIFFIFGMFCILCIVAYMGDWFNYFAIKKNLEHINDLRAFFDVNMFNFVDSMVQKSVNKVLEADPKNINLLCSKMWKEDLNYNLFFNDPVMRDLVISLYMKLYYMAKNDMEREIIVKLIETYVNRYDYFEDPINNIYTWL